MLEVPCTQGFAGFARAVGVPLHRIVRSPALERLRLPGVMRRLGALDKITLSPETSTLDDMKALTHALVADGVRTLTMTLHSPSVERAHTPYVRTSADLQAFFDRMERYFAFFFESVGGVAGTLDGFRHWPRIDVVACLRRGLGGCLRVTSLDGPCEDAVGP